MTPNRIPRDKYLALMDDDLHGSVDARSKRASRIAKANGHRQYRKPGQPGWWYDPKEAMKSRAGTALPKAV